MGDNKNVLYLSYDGMTDSLGQSQVIPYLAGLTKNGFSFTILSFEKKDRYKKSGSDIRTILDAACITWHPLIYTKSPPVLSTVYDYTRMKQTAASLHRKAGFDLIHCRSYIPALVGMALNSKYRIPFIFDMRGFWADERVDGGLWNLKNPVFKFIYRYFKKKELKFLNRSAAIVSLTVAGKNEILNWKGVEINAGKISVIPCCVDTGLFDINKIRPGEKEPVMRSLNLAPNDLVLGYLGSIGTWYLLDEMLLFFSLLKKRAPSAKFLFVTHDDPEDIIHKARRHQIDSRDIIIMKAERRDVPLMISLFNYGIFFIKPSYSKTASSPTKQGEIMAMGVPVICNDGIGDSSRIVEQYHSGLVVDLHNYDKAISKMTAGMQYDRASIRAGALDYFSLDEGVKKYMDIYINVTK
ncbi:glycosyltransferase [Mucilaginibacter ginsenosidivorans]|uniref:Glycosyltransferase family 4 protein n=1 Tax=Mucilaginibacter ginsenosidivorans TaxID=398053 RepID=A0A5B8UUB6_9SPHI|nr:glycosyltransferase [Mucilaginibacter ginsenosidivorans]QEC62036.1 glycosyltransferase family 4 protein [Mucilaginibacter ginsenosidivorans]